MEALKTVLGMLIVPPAGPVLLALLGWLLSRRRPLLGRSLVAVGIASLWLLSIPAIAWQIERLAENDRPLDPARLKETGAQAIVILGGGGQRTYAPEYMGPAANAYLLERLAYGAWLAKLTGLPLLVTGNGIEAVAMRETLQRNFGVDTRWMEDRARDTFENARNSTALLRQAGVHRILLVSSAAHVWRGSQEFRAAGLEVVGAPAHVYTPVDPSLYSYLPDAGALVVAKDAIHELIGEGARELFAATHLRRQPH